MPEDHPEAQLASYVEGSATDEERRLVEAHVAECSTCRADVDFATRGRAAMQALPELESPGLAQQGLAWLPQPDREATMPTALPLGRRRAPKRRPFGPAVWQRIAWGSGIAVAASLAAVFLFISLNGSSNKATTAAGGAADRNAEAFSPARSQANYDRASIDALARRLAQQPEFGREANSTAAAPAPAVGGPTPLSGAVASPAAKSLDQVSTAQAVSCLRRGAGLVETVTPSYVEVASFDGKPAFVGAFPAGPSGGSPTHLLVIVVDQVSCQPLYAVTLPI